MQTTRRSVDPWIAVVLIVTAITCFSGCDRSSAESIHEAAADGDIAQVAHLLQQRVSINSRDEHGYTALHYVARNGQVKMTTVLLANRADVDVVGDDGRTPLLCAAEARQWDVSQLLRAKGAQLDIFSASALGLTAEVEAFIASEPAAVNKPIVGHKTPLHFAVAGGRIDTVQCLIAKGADVNALGPEGTALTMARAQGAADIEAVLIERGAIAMAAPGDEEPR